MKWLSWISGIVVLTIAALSFVLSFHALSLLGVQSKAFPQELAWIFPLIIDGAIICFSLAALRAALEKESTKCYSFLIVAATLSSVVFNVLSIEEGALGRVLAAFPPILLAISFETFLNQMRVGFRKSQVAEKKKGAAIAKGAEGKKKAQRTKKDGVKDRQQRISQLQADGKTNSEIAESLKISGRTLFRDLEEMGKAATQLT
jgi:enolase